MGRSPIKTGFVQINVVNSDISDIAENKNV